MFVWGTSTSWAALPGDHFVFVSANPSAVRSWPVAIPGGQRPPPTERCPAVVVGVQQRLELSRV
eukprot:11967540-Heterocapsa_arctica.AAC.1